MQRHRQVHAPGNQSSELLTTNTAVFFPGDCEPRAKYTVFWRSIQFVRLNIWVKVHHEMKNPNQIKYGAFKIGTTIRQSDTTVCMRKGRKKLNKNIGHIFHHRLTQPWPKATSGCLVQELRAAISSHDNREFTKGVWAHFVQKGLSASASIRYWNPSAAKGDTESYRRAIYIYWHKM